MLIKASESWPIKWVGFKPHGRRPRDLVRCEYVLSCTVHERYTFVHLIWISASGLPSGSPLSWCTARDRDTTVSNLTCNWRTVSNLNCYWLIFPFDFHTARERDTTVSNLTCSWRIVSKLNSYCLIFPFDRYTARDKQLSVTSPAVRGPLVNSNAISLFFLSTITLSHLQLEES